MISKNLLVNERKNTRFKSSTSSRNICSKAEEKKEGDRARRKAKKYRYANFKQLEPLIRSHTTLLECVLRRLFPLG